MQNNSKNALIQWLQSQAAAFLCVCACARMRAEALFVFLKNEQNTTAMISCGDVHKLTRVVSK